MDTKPHVLEYVLPVLAILFGVYSLFFRRGGTLWGLPGTFWYSIWIVVGMLAIILTWLARKE